MMRGVVVLVATRKGAWLYTSDGGRDKWGVDGPHFLGHVVNHMVLDPRDRRTLLAAAKTGHLGPTIFRSADRGASWTEAARPPAFPKAREGEAARAVDHTFWLTPGHVSQEDLWYAGTSPQGLFRSGDGGATWELFSAIDEDVQYRAWMGGAQDGTPDGAKLHSILVDPRDPAHLYFAMSGGGVHESLDGGASFAPLVDGLEVVEGFDATNVAFHDPHCVRLCPANPDRLYQQNHCGIYRLDRPSRTWRRIGKSMPREVGDIGFPMVVHPRDADTAWVFPMDGTQVWPRTSPGGKPAVYMTRNGGERWQRLDAGMPEQQAWWTVKRQAMVVDTLRGGRARIAAAMRVLIPSALVSYTERNKVEASGRTLGEVLGDLDRRYPGIRFRMVDEQDRIRRHIRIFINAEQVLDLARPLEADDEVVIVQALSGG